MSTAQTPPVSAAPSPQPLHNPSLAAVVQPPQAPANSGATGTGTVPSAPGMGAKALLAKRMAKGSNPSITSPTDKLMTPVSAKLSAAKKKHFMKGGAMRPMAPTSSNLNEAAKNAQDDDDE